MKEGTEFSVVMHRAQILETKWKNGKWIKIKEKNNGRGNKGRGYLISLIFSILTFKIDRRNILIDDINVTMAIRILQRYIIS